jgi:hypothetical protein
VENPAGEFLLNASEQELPAETRIENLPNSPYFTEN